MFWKKWYKLTFQTTDSKVNWLYLQTYLRQPIKHNSHTNNFNIHNDTKPVQYNIEIILERNNCLSICYYTVFLVGNNNDSEPLEIQNCIMTPQFGQSNGFLFYTL
jgi:hypothetical protein